MHQCPTVKDMYRINGIQSLTTHIFFTEIYFMITHWLYLRTITYLHLQSLPCADKPQGIEPFSHWSKTSLFQQSSRGQHGAHLGPVGPRWVPCWPHEPCYQGRDQQAKWWPCFPRNAQILSPLNVIHTRFNVVPKTLVVICPSGATFWPNSIFQNSFKSTGRFINHTWLWLYCIRLTNYRMPLCHVCYASKKSYHRPLWKITDSINNSSKEFRKYTAVVLSLYF